MGIERKGTRKGKLRQCSEWAEMSNGVWRSLLGDNAALLLITKICRRGVRWLGRRFCVFEGSGVKICRSIAYALKMHSASQCAKPLAQKSGKVAARRAIVRAPAITSRIGSAALCGCFARLQFRGGSIKNNPVPVNGLFVFLNIVGLCIKCAPHRKV